MNPDIVRERSRASFNVEELTNVLDDGATKTTQRRYIENIFAREPLFDKVSDFFVDRDQAYEKSLQRGLRFMEMTKEYNIVDREDLYIAAKSVGSSLPFSLSNLMFTPSIMNLGTEEQKKKWLPIAQTYQILGTYAQTELGHGTNVRGLETIATYDKTRQEFVMHSPTLSACKWWPGLMAHTSTHAIVVAQLIIDGKNHGVQFFIVQLRDLNDHKPLPGIKVGDIGPKNSIYMNGSDNGYLLLDNVRIPRENMLMGLSKVSPDGKFIKPQNSKVLYGTMLYVRASIPRDTFGLLSRAVTIAIRYSAVRRQSELKAGEGELQIIDFKTQQYKLLPALAAAYATKFASVRVMNEYIGLQSKLMVKDFSSLPEMHSITSSLKAFLTGQALHHAENCRLSCGGHGYSAFSMLPELYMVINAACTYEGDNTVLLLQVARYLLKCVSIAQAGQTLPSTISYLTNKDSGMVSPVNSTEQLLNPQVQLQLYRDRSQRMITVVAEKMQKKVFAGMDPMDAWNAFSVDLLHCATAHSFYLTVLYFTDSIRTGLSNVSSPTRSVLKSLCDLYSLHGIMENSGSFLEFGILNASQVGMVKQEVYNLFEQIRPDAVSLVDAFDYSDRDLNSPLGKYDGNVYQQLFDWAQKSPLNRQPVLPAYGRYLKSLLQGGKSKL